MKYLIEEESKINSWRIDKNEISIRARVSIPPELGFTFFQERLAAFDVVLTDKAFFDVGFTSLRITLGRIFSQFNEDLFQGTDGERGVISNGSGGFIHELFDF